MQWRVDRLALQKRILRRMREFGMTPVLPGFAGFVPDGFTRLFPAAKVERLNWFMDAPFNGVLQLQPTEQLFQSIGGKFVAKMRKMFFDAEHGGGTSLADVGGYIYNVDTYNEMNPTSADSKYLADSSAAVLAGLQAGDKDAVWLMQGWLFLCKI